MPQIKVYSQTFERQCVSSYHILSIKHSARNDDPRGKRWILKNKSVQGTFAPLRSKLRRVKYQTARINISAAGTFRNERYLLHFRRSIAAELVALRRALSLGKLHERVFVSFRDETEGRSLKNERRRWRSALELRQGQQPFAGWRRQLILWLLWAPSGA